MAGVPRRVKNDYTICADQIDAQAPGSGRNEEEQNIGIRVEFVHQLLSFHAGCARKYDLFLAQRSSPRSNDILILKLVSFVKMIMYVRITWNGALL